MVKNLPIIRETWVWSLGQEDPLEKGMATPLFLLFPYTLTPVFLSGEFHGQRRLAGYSPWGHKELDSTKRPTHTHTSDQAWVREGKQLAQHHSVSKQSNKWAKVTQSCLTLCDIMDHSPPDSSVHGIFQARIWEWFAIPFSRGSSCHRDGTQVSCIVGRFFTIWTTWLGFKPMFSGPTSGSFGLHYFTSLS